MKRSPGMNWKNAALRGGLVPDVYRPDQHLRKSFWPGVDVDAFIYQDNGGEYIYFNYLRMGRETVSPLIYHHGTGCGIALRGVIRGKVVSEKFLPLDRETVDMAAGYALRGDVGNLRSLIQALPLLDEMTETDYD